MEQMRRGDGYEIGRGLQESKDLRAVMGELLLELDSYPERVTIDPQSVGSNFGEGRSSYKQTTTGFELDNPLKCVLDLPGRPVNEAYMYANIIWTFTGSDDASMIGFYNPRAAKFANDDGVVECAWGPKLFREGEGFPGQVGHVVEILRKDPDSRRGAIDLISMEELVEDRVDISCAMGTQYGLRTMESGTRHLDTITIMRSQSVIGIMPYDLPLMVSLQSMIAAELEVELGTYIHYAFSMHMYTDEYDRLKASGWPEQPAIVRTLPPAPTYRAMRPLFDLENKIRQAALADEVPSLAVPESVAYIDDESEPLFCRRALQAVLGYADTRLSKKN